MGGIFGGHTTHIEHERLGAFSINNSTYGLTIPVVCGTNRISSNIIDYYNFNAIAHTTTQKTGKGGGSKVETTSYTYEVVVCLGLCEGVVKNIGKVWKNDNIVTLGDLNLTLFTGQIGQSPWAYTQGQGLTDHVLPYSGLAYVAGKVDLGTSASLPQLGFEVTGLLTETGDGVDANPADIVKLILCDKNNGIGLDESSIDAESLENFRTYCKACDLLISPTFTDQTKAVDTLKEIFEATNTIYFWSQNKLKFVPRTDSQIVGEKATYTPDLTPLYDLTAEDFIELDDGALITFERANRSETYNHQEVKFLNRVNEYNEELAEFKIQTDINRRGLKSASQKDYSFICTKERAQYVAQILTQESLLGRTTYKFSLDWSFCLLEPGDIVTLTDKYLGLDKMLVRIESVEEQDDYTINFTAKQITGAATAAKYETNYNYTRPSIDTNTVPSATHEPFIYKMPESQAVGIAVCGSDSNWGGCDVWISLDNLSYEYLGSINAPSRYGQLLTDLPVNGNSVDVELFDKSLQLLSVSEQAAQNNAAPVKIGNEWLSYQTAELIGTGQYRLSNLSRGIYDTALQNHSAGDLFVRYDTANFYYNYTKADEGKTIYLKLPAKNVFGKAVQDLAECSVYQFTVPVSTNTAVETGTREYTAQEEWQSFDFNTPFASVPYLFVINCQTTNGAVYYRNLTATGFEAKVINIKAVQGQEGQEEQESTDIMAATITYTAQGVR